MFSWPMRVYERSSPRVRNYIALGIMVLIAAIVAVTSLILNGTFPSLSNWANDLPWYIAVPASGISAVVTFYVMICSPVFLYMIIRALILRLLR